GGAGRDARRSAGEGGAACRDPVRARPGAARLSALRLLDDPDPGRAPAHRDRVPVRDAGAVVAALARAGRVVRRAAAGVLGADDAGAGAGRGRGRARAGTGPGRVDRPRGVRGAAPLVAEQVVGPGGSALDAARVRTRAGWRACMAVALHLAHAAGSA